MAGVVSRGVWSRYRLKSSYRHKNNVSPFSAAPDHAGVLFAADCLRVVAAANTGGAGGPGPGAGGAGGGAARPALRNPADIALCRAAGGPDRAAHGDPF